VIGRLIGRDHPKGDVVRAAALDPPRRALAHRVGVEQQRDHHRWLVRRATPPVVAIRRIERGKIKLTDRLNQKPRQMALGQPLAQTRRQQQLLLAIAAEEVLGHPGIVLKPPDDPALCDSLHGKR
jgi:hypothetical protein